MTDEPTLNDLRSHVYRHFVDHCLPPTLSETARAFEVTREWLIDAFQSLAAAHVLVLDPESSEIWMAMPFSAVPTPYRVQSGQQSWWAN